MSSNNFGWFANRYRTPGGVPFVPTVNIEEIITANGFQYQGTITSNIPNATVNYNMDGTLPTSEIVGGVRTAQLTNE